MVYSYEEIKDMFNRLVLIGCEPEFEIRLFGNYYMIIGYDDHYSFQRCGDNKSGEINFSSLDDLYQSVTIDGICLKSDWDKIEDMFCYDFEDIDSIEKMWNECHNNPDFRI
ncbi:MAG: hypothetical protein J1E36_01135 [Eubacterium sp.]|nr:hypothetical protein [Eubacterium sp.]